FKIESTAKNQKNKERVQAVLDSHWEMNNWEYELFTRVKDLGVLGELVSRLPPMDKPINGVEVTYNTLGMFRAGLVIPHLIQRCILTPWNYESLDAIYM